MGRVYFARRLNSALIDLIVESTEVRLTENNILGKIRLPEPELRLSLVAFFW